jgi:hypothetical protein
VPTLSTVHVPLIVFPLVVPIHVEGAPVGPTPRYVKLSPSISPLVECEPDAQLTWVSVQPV